MQDPSVIRLRPLSIFRGLRRDLAEALEDRRARRRGLLLALLLIAMQSSGGAQSSSATIRLGITAQRGAARVQTLALDDYVARVIAGEGEPKAPDAAQDALAIAVRTFALANRNRHRREGFDMCDTTHCQVLRPATAASLRAAQATAGRVLVYQGQPATVFYSAWCGGHPERASEVWPGASEYTSEPVEPDTACTDEPGWTSELSERDVERALRLGGLEGRRLRNLVVLQRNASGRVTRLAADGFTPREISGNDFRMAVARIAGPRALKSTTFELKKVSRAYRFEGSGYGHGVGLCVVGAGRRAAAGAGADEILQFYYPGLRIERLGVSSTTAAASAPPVSPPRTAPVARDLQLTLPTRDEVERAALSDLIRRTRDDIVKRAGLPAAAPALRITVHQSVDSFGRATGQPWWMTGATDGTIIDLAPVSTLRQQGQLERAIRHEVAHALLDSMLLKRPQWVREGAAFHFAGLTPESPKAGSVTCPKDEEFLRPVSAGAYRDAVARAATCFARAIRGGKSWREVK
jgi:stage II sporulation protein D